MKRIALFLTNLFSLFLSGCETRETLAEVEFENARFGLEYIPDRSLEGYNEKYHPYFIPAGSSEKKYLLKAGGGLQFNNYPKNPSLLDGIDVVIVDTIPRTYEKYDQTVALSTLYVDPKLVDKASWKTLTRFVTQSYSQPDTVNPLLKWLNYRSDIGTSINLNTIFALVYINSDDLEPQYTRADGKRRLKVGIDEGIYLWDDAEVNPGWMHTGRLTDSVFHYWAGRAEMVPEFREYELRGKKFKSLYQTEQGEN